MWRSEQALLTTISMTTQSCAQCQGLHGTHAMGASATVHCQGLYGLYDCYLPLSRFQQIMSLPSTGCLLLTMSFMRYEMSFLIFSIFIKSNKVSSAEFTSSDILLLSSWSYCVCFWLAICPHQHVKLTFNIKIFG